MAGRDLAAPGTPLGSDVQDASFDRAQTRSNVVPLDRAAVVSTSGVPGHGQQNVGDHVRKEDQDRHAHILSDRAVLRAMTKTPADAGASRVAPTGVDPVTSRSPAAKHSVGPQLLCDLVPVHVPDVQVVLHAPEAVCLTPEWGYISEEIDHENRMIHCAECHEIRNEKEGCATVVVRHCGFDREPPRVAELCIVNRLDVRPETSSFSCATCSISLAHAPSSENPPVPAERCCTSATSAWQEAIAASMERCSDGEVNGGSDGRRSRDLTIFSRALYQLSYRAGWRENAPPRRRGSPHPRP